MHDEDLILLTPCEQGWSDDSVVAMPEMALFRIDPTLELAPGGLGQGVDPASMAAGSAGNVITSVMDKLWADKNAKVASDAAKEVAKTQKKAALAVSKQDVLRSQIEAERDRSVEEQRGYNMQQALLIGGGIVTTIAVSIGAIVLLRAITRARK